MAIETTVTSAAAWRPDVYTFVPDDAVPDALILQAATLSGEIEGDQPSLRVAYVTDDAADFVAEAAEIEEANPALSEAVVYTAKVSQLVALSNEQYRQDRTPQQLADSVQRAVTKRADQAFLAQVAPTSPAVAPPAGLLNIAGVIAGGAVEDSLDALADLLATIETNGGQPSHLIMSPTAWANGSKLKTGTDSNAALLGAGTEAAERRLLSLPVLVSAAMAGTNGLVIDKRAVVAALGPVRVAVSEHRYFETDSVALRCTWRIGWAAVRPNRLGKFTVPAATP